MTDVESVQPRANRSNNPYADSGSPIRSRWHPINILQRAGWMGGSIYLLHRMNTYKNILTSPDISHQWFKVGLASSVALFSLKAYIEMYTGKLQKKEVSYKTVPQSTHAAIGLIVFSGISFNIALWPVYGGNSMFVMFLVGTFLINFCLMFPTIIQNLIAFSVLTFFIQEYQ